MSKETWHKGYQEVKNVIHNDIGITKEEILDVFRQVARDEIEKLISENSGFIYAALTNVIEREMLKAIQEHKYPKVSGHMWDFGYYGQGKVPFKDYVSGVMKEEIIRRMEEQFIVNVNIDKKTNL